MIALRFPNIKTRHYPIPADQMFAVVDKLVIDRGWDVRLRHAPDGAGADGQINAIDMTLLGFRDEVSIRVSDDAEADSEFGRRYALCLADFAARAGRQWQPRRGFSQRSR